MARLCPPDTHTKRLETNAGEKTDDKGDDTAEGGERYDLSILQSLRRIMRAVDIYSRKLTSMHGITTPQLICLLTVKEMGPMTSIAIANEMHISPSTLVGILDRLEAKKLIERERATKDRRRVYITTTARGREVADTAPSPLQDRLVEGLDGLSERELKKMSASLKKIVGLMEAEGISAAPLLDAKEASYKRGGHH